MPKTLRPPLKVIKVPLDRTVRTDFTKDFPRQPRLYLELLENVAKIKPTYLGKEFIPDYSLVKQPTSPVIEKSIFNDSDAESDDDSVSSEIDKPFINDNEDNEDDDEDELTKQLKSLLEADEISSAGSITPSRDHQSVRSKKRTPPTLDQLRAAGAYAAPQKIKELGKDISEDEEEDRKRELLFKFDLLKKSYKSSQVPEFSIHSDYKTMERTYEHTVKKLSLDSTVENYKTYLIGGFMVVEYVFGSWFKFDMQGFTQQQILSMNSYEKLLIELGEKSYVPEGSQWPVELRLLFLIIINAAFFIISRMILRKTGSNLMNMVNSMNTAQAPPSTARRAKRKMRGPSINLDEIPEFTN